MRHIVLLVVGLTTLGCAAKPRPVVVAPVPVDTTPADCLFDAGCYTCLKQAFETYERARTGPVPSPDARERAFETAVLLALREKELGLDATPWLERATTLATPDERRYLDITTALPWTDAVATSDFDPTGWLSSTALADWRPTLVPTSVHQTLDQYVLVTLACSTGKRTLDEDTQQAVDMARPIISYRAGLCGQSHRPRLEALVAADARFVEAWFFIGRYEMASGVSPSGASLPSRRRWLVTVPPLLSAAHDGLPEAPIVTTVLAGVMRARGELSRALSLYDEAIALRPTQRDALLGRTVTLTYLERHDEAIETATRMITLGTWHLGSAYYFRAWNEYQKGQLDAAASDVAVARRLQASDDVLVLSGLVAFDQKRFIDARSEFQDAVQLNAARCIAHWHLGILNLDDQAWPAAVSTFSTAAECYKSAAEGLRAEAGQLPPDLPDDAREQQMATYDNHIAINVTQAGRSHYNAAQASVRVGDTPTALLHARSATAYAEMKERADAIVQKLMQSGESSRPLVR